MAKNEKKFAFIWRAPLKQNDFWFENCEWLVKVEFSFNENMEFLFKR